MTNLTLCEFGDIDSDDEFFDSLKEDYPGFEKWFQTKSNAHEKAYVFYRVGKVDGFLYLKPEDGPVDDLEPVLPAGKYLKVGTMKINAHGTKLGERFIKKILDHAIFSNVDGVYTTVFEKHNHLINLISRYGFKKIGTKKGLEGEGELVFYRDMTTIEGDVLQDYPYIPSDTTPYLLAIWPKYHTKFLPDSKLHNESFNILEDVSHTNSIHKAYISGISATGNLKKGDVIVIYRTSDYKGPAKYRSVATSIGVVEETRRIKSFDSKAAFLKYVKPYSVFSTPELEARFAKKQHVVIRFTYNAALTKRIIRARLLDEVGISSQPRWDFRKLSQKQLNAIIQLGELNENFIID